jgi:hypothetical protein
MCFARSKGKRRAQECGPMPQIYFPIRQIFVLSFARNKERNGVAINADAMEVYLGGIRRKSERFGDMYEPAIQCSFSTAFVIAVAF